MSRRRRAQKRERLPDYKYKSEILTHFINNVMREGQFNDELRLHLICHDHGGSDGTTYTDCTTGLEIAVGPQPNYIRKLLTDSWKEAAFWVLIMVKYACFTVADLIRHIFYWRSIRTFNELFRTQTGKNDIVEKETSCI